MKHEQIGQRYEHADHPDEGNVRLGPDLWVPALERVHDAAVAIQGDGHQGDHARVDADVLEKQAGRYWCNFYSIVFE